MLQKKHTPKKPAETKGGITSWAPGPGCACSECFWRNCHWLLDTINSHKNRSI